MMTVKQLREALADIDENTPVLVRSDIPRLYREVEGTFLECVERAQVPNLGNNEVRHLWSTQGAGPRLEIVDNYVALIIDDGTSWIKKR